LSPLPHTLFARAALALLAIFLAVQGTAFFVVWKTAVEPLRARSAEDLAARIALAAQTWVELPPATRADYEIELSLQHNLELGKVSQPLTTLAPDSAFGALLENAVLERTGQKIRVKQGTNPSYSWVELKLADHLLRVGFENSRYELKAPLEAAAVFLAGGLLTMLAVLLLARRISRQLAGVARSAQIVGQGRTPERLPETGSEEFRQLARAFNRMADEVQKLLENRTVLLSGISHDLRTPITRLRLALSMLDSEDSAMVRRMEGDLEEMSRLISEMLDFSRALKGADNVELDLAAVLGELAEDAARSGAVEWQVQGPCPMVAGERALRRIVANLIGNALRYGEGKPVDLELDCQPGSACIRVLDRGPGIPESELETVFQPFYRLEDSRARDTGGSGLGLAIVRQLADAYGWQVMLRPREGGGLCAELLMPRGATIAARLH
jgi:two-component system osmolarity sensor histidine kinase EnvZ